MNAGKFPIWNDLQAFVWPHYRHFAAKARVVSRVPFSLPPAEATSRFFIGGLAPGGVFRSESLRPGFEVSNPLVER